MSQVFKNGISIEQSLKAKALIKSAGFRKVALKIGTTDMTIHNILRGESPSVEILEQAIIAAKEIISKKEEILKNLPV